MLDFLVVQNGPYVSFVMQRTNDVQAPRQGQIVNIVFREAPHGPCAEAGEHRVAARPWSASVWHVGQRVDSGRYGRVETAGDVTEALAGVPSDPGEDIPPR